MLSNETIITDAMNESLITLYEARLALNLMSSTDAVLMDQLELIVDWASSEIALLCNRVFAKMTVSERVTELPSNRLYLSHYPITTITSVVENGTSLVSGVDYQVDTEAGRLTRTKSIWSEPIVVTYTGGYELPFEAPKSLRRAALLLAREAYYGLIRGDPAIRMVSHNESRVIYFDPSAQMKSGGSSGTAATRAIDDILKSYTRFYV